MKTKTCCCTGHRPQGLPWGNSTNGEAYDKYFKELTFKILELINNGYTHFISGVALGVDMDFAEIVLWFRDEKELPITLECAIPCPEQSKKWQQPDIDRYHFILSRADKQTLISKTYTSSCMLARNRYMVDHSDTLLAVWNGTKHGGTWYTMEY
ncbi:MAG: SLOG family protein, partial [Clostridia bacterium]